MSFPVCFSGGIVRVMPMIEPKSPRAKDTWERYSGLVGGENLLLLEELCAAQDEHLELLIRVRRGDVDSGQRKHLRELEASIARMSGQLARWVAWGSLNDRGV